MRHYGFLIAGFSQKKKFTTAVQGGSPFAVHRLRAHHEPSAKLKFGDSQAQRAWPDSFFLCRIGNPVILLKPRDQ